MTEVRPGQIWADNDPRSAGRTLRVDAVENGKATCTVLTNTTKAQEKLDRGSAWFQDTRGRVTRISLSRFRPTSTGYRLVSEGEARDA
ncbi:hypothetical protein [Microbispora sp. KK1-11]|uniref:hypothetical protein n=1 Tax=Microbispora sp. KK1-11 TaxID=2053005 RepID=UPI00115AF6CD|nr:hypothetical protein [Microbispora sp. KK1-11]TQS30023.1 hypothetical protein FLW16_06585 [Microbispora sp. KK1-11]